MCTISVNKEFVDFAVVKSIICINTLVTFRMSTTMLVGST